MVLGNLELFTRFKIVLVTALFPDVFTPDSCMTTAYSRSSSDDELTLLLVDVGILTVCPGLIVDDVVNPLVCNSELIGTPCCRLIDQRVYLSWNNKP